jgi:hypothetical protein
MMSRYTGPEMISSSQLEKCHPSFSTAKDEISGPKVGPIEATAAHMATANGNWAGNQMSAKDAPAVARHGDAIKPSKNRRTMRPG